MPADFDPEKILALLIEHEVEFIVIGGVAAILHGSPVMTGDLDVVYETGPQNLARIVKALQSIHAIYRDPAGRIIAPDADKLASIKIHLMKTDLGSLDFLRSIGADLTYSDLIAKTAPFEVAGFQVPVLDLEPLIEAKEFAGRPKDRVAVLYLRELLERREGLS